MHRRAARQRFVLTPEALEVHLAFTNQHTQLQPVGLGWHPYFPRRPRSRLHAELSDRWESDPTGLPTRKVPQAGIDAITLMRDAGIAASTVNSPRCRHCWRCLACITS